MRTSLRLLVSVKIIVEKLLRNMTPDLATWHYLVCGSPLKVKTARQEKDKQDSRDPKTRVMCVEPDNSGKHVFRSLVVQDLIAKVNLWQITP